MNRFYIECLLKYNVLAPTNFVFMLQIAPHASQTIVQESLTLSPALQHHNYLDITGLNRMLRVQAAPQPCLALHYCAEVELIQPDYDQLTLLPELAIADLPNHVMHYLLSSRYCPTELLTAMAMRTFASLSPGYARVQGICDWIYTHIDYVRGSSDETTTARDVLVQRAGVCRDFAHLAITFCRCLGIPARMVAGYVKFPRTPPDFHAIFEAFLGGQWVLFDPTKMVNPYDVIRIATGMDAVDVAFCSFYGEVNMLDMQPLVSTIDPE